MINITNTVNPLWISFYKVYKDINDDYNVDFFTPEKPSDKSESLTVLSGFDGVYPACPDLSGMIIGSPVH
jgi:hypothetical protein